MAAVMRKVDAVAAAVAALPDAPTVFTTGFTARLATDRPNHLPLTGSMGLALPVGIGIARGSRRTTLVLDGDGSLLMNPAGLLTLGAEPDLPVLHVVLDDGVYASTGGQPSPGGRVDLVALAGAAGVPGHVARTPEDLAELLTGLAADGRAAFVHAPVTPDLTPPGPRVGTGLADVAARFTRWCRQDATTLSR
ncbi:MAG: hypothetical protein BGO96_06840 [Micrococcales bacterium 73-15]|nr:MAG: hypothetical protein BGO96_06840 [Micrococcales bacterium 73-15]